MKQISYDTGSDRITVHSDLNSGMKWTYSVLLDGKKTGSPIIGPPFRTTYFDEMFIKNLVNTTIRSEIEALTELFGLDRG